jgi:3-oxoacyl-[acyl-carrier protein] reductase
MDLGLTAKTALVLAASKGLGKAIAGALVAEGAEVVICSSSKDRIEQAAAEIGATPMVCDLTNVAQVPGLVAACDEAIGTPDIVVVNCGGPYASSFMDTPAEAWDREYAQLWSVPLEILRSYLPRFQERGSGRIVWVTSVAAAEPVSDVVISSSLRAGLHGLVKALSDEYARYGITINAVLPGYIKTDRLEELSHTNLSAARIPMNRFGSADDFGALAAFIASDRASYITGQMIACDGGWLRR